MRGTTNLLCPTHPEEERTSCTQNIKTKAQQVYWRDLGKVCEDASVFNKMYLTDQLYYLALQTHMFNQGLLCPQAWAFGGGQEERITFRPVGRPHSCSLAGGKPLFLLQVKLRRCLHDNFAAFAWIRGWKRLSSHDRASELISMKTM